MARLEEAQKMQEKQARERRNRMQSEITSDKISV